MTMIWPFLVVLAPALLSAVLGLFVTVTPWVVSTFKPWFHQVLKSEEKVEHLRDQVVAISFIGPAAGIVLGFSADTFGAAIVGLAIFVLGQWIAWKLVGMLERIRTESETLQASELIGSIAQHLQEQEALRLASNRETWKD